MKKSIVFYLFVFCAINVFAQISYEPFQSLKLSDERQIKIQLPRNYSANKNKDYPLFIVLDGDYLFEVVAGNVDYCSYWEEMPDAFVVGINQVGKYDDDNLYSSENSLPIEKGAEFFEFIGTELIPFLEKKYRIGRFKVAVGHAATANFISYYLLKPDPLFKGYISISPDFAPNMLTYLPQALGGMQSKVFYYMFNTANSPATITQMVNALNTDLSVLNNKNVRYHFKNFDDSSFNSLPTYAIPTALESMFKIYKPISKKEYLETILKLEGSPSTYLSEKYQTIQDLFGVKKQILINDFKAIAAAIEETKKFEAYEELAKLAKEHYPETLLNGYYLGRFYEETGDARKAMRTYQAAFILKEIAGITKEKLLEKADAIKKDFGYE